MNSMQINLAAPIFDSFRVQQVAGIFDVPLEEKMRMTLNFEKPDVDSSDWKIGLIVGPSGSGKSTVARELFGKDFHESAHWSEDRAVVDDFPTELSTKEITALLTSVGFSSPPGWVKPYAILSNGEKFRCDLARTLSLAKIPGGKERILAFDEFTSVVDRTVAKSASAALAKGIRNGSIPARFVAVTCHYDVAEWLEPDWILDMATRKISRRRLRRPEIRLEIRKAGRSIWTLFARHHYLSGILAPAAQCYVALWEETPVAFCAVMPLISKKNRRRISRLVTLPDFQGLGIGMKLAESVGEIYRENGFRLNITGSHPAVIAHCRNSPLWRTVTVRGATSAPKESAIPRYRGSGSRLVVSFEYVPKTRRD